MDQRFMEGHLIDWSVLEWIGLSNKVRDLTSIKGFAIEETTSWELTMEVMSLSKLDRTIISLS